MENTLLQETADLVRKRLGGSLAEITEERAVFGLFFSGVKLSSGQDGLCFTPVKDMPEAVCCPSSARAMPLSGKLKGRPVTDYLDYIFDNNILKRTLGIAALNALSSLCFELEPPQAYTVSYGRDAFDDVDPTDCGHTVVVGALVPMLKKLLAAEAGFQVLEMDPRTLKGRELEHDLPAGRASECAPRADLLVITGVTILNNGLPDLLALAKPGAEITVSGPTASMLPEALFSPGCHQPGGIMVTRAGELPDLISERGSGYHFFGKCAERSVIRGIA